MGMMAAIISHFLSLGQFRGSSGSSGPKVTRVGAELVSGRRGSASREEGCMVNFEVS
jgi:hypothetical protein